jgi:tetratricopeptide (TPR) repeat protein
MKPESVKQPTTPDELSAMHKILRSDPQRYLRIVNEWIRKDPKNHQAYFSRHFVWAKIGAPREAIDDLNKVVELESKPDPITFLSRGQVYRHLGEYEKAIEDFDRAEAIDPVEWRDGAFGPFFQADTHARLGNEVAALACCARLPDDFWTPGFEGAPGGGKAEIADELRRRAAQARRKRS